MRQTLAHSRNFERFVQIIGATASLGYLWQAYQIWVHQSAEDISLLTFSHFLFIQGLFLIWGWVRRDSMMYWAFGFNFIANLLVIAGIIYYSS